MAKLATNKVQTTIYLPKAVHTKLRMKAFKQHVSMTKLIIHAVTRDLRTSTVNNKSGS